MGLMLSEVSHTKTNTLHFHLFVESKKKKIRQMNKYNKPEKDIDTENKLVVTRTERSRGRSKIGEGD